jgi:FkbM family methyltransferase
MLNKPHYAFRPSQAVRRFRGSNRVVLPWGEMEVDPTDAVGGGIARMGVWELAVSEVVTRLLRPGDTALDVGANIGYFSLLMKACGARVTAYEPHPRIAEQLRRNVPGVDVIEAAVSDREGRGWLVEPEAANAGTGHLGEEGIPVRLTRIDREAAVMKIDCEGHELPALGGMTGTPRHILFEEHDRPPTPVTELLAERGYMIFRVDESFLGPVLANPQSTPPKRFDAPNYLATLDDVRHLIEPRGWRCLSRRHWHQVIEE